jgi:hypothetical protein
MELKPFPLLLCRAVIARQGIADDVATRTAVLLSLADLPLPQHLVLSLAVGRRRADEAKATAPADDTVELPNVVKKPLSQVRDSLDAFTLEISEEESQEQPGTILRQEPLPGRVPRSSTVKLFVAKAADTTSGDQPA